MLGPIHITFYLKLKLASRLVYNFAVLHYYNLIVASYQLSFIVSLKHEK